MSQVSSRYTVRRASTGSATGAHQASDPNAMPLKDFIAETMNILKRQPEAMEICVERVKPLRFAEANGGYDKLFKQFNDQVSAAWAQR